MGDVRSAVAGGLFTAVCAGIGLAAWEGWHPEWERVAMHAALAGVIAGLIVYFSEDRDLDEPEPARHQWLPTLASYLVFAGTGAWALTGAELPDLAIFALTVSGLFVLAHLAGTLRSRRRERDQLGL